MDKEGYLAQELPTSYGQNSADGALSFSVVSASTPSMVLPDTLPSRGSIPQAEAMRKIDSAKERTKNFKELASELLLAAVEALDREHQLQLAMHGNPMPQVADGGGPSRLLFEGAHISIVSDESMRPRGSREHEMPVLTASKSNLGIFTLLPDWEEESQEDADTFADIDAEKVARMQYRAGLKKLLDDRNATPLSGRRGSSSHCRVASPAASWRLYWDVLAAVLLTFEALIAPMAVFEMPEDGVLFILRVLQMFYWTGDIVASFLVGYYREADGEIELHFQAVAARYMRTWFGFDVLVVGLDWATYGAKLFTGSSPIGTDSAGVARMSKVSRIIRVIRLVRLARLAKLRRLIVGFQDSIGLERSAILFSLGKNLCRIWFIVHYLACAWYWIGTRSPHSWSSGVSSSSWWYNYLRSVQWSLANFTPGTSSLQPKTAEELLFAVIVLYFALVVFSIFVSSTTSLINRLVGMQAARDKQLFLLKAFLRQHNFDAALRERVLRYVQAAMGGKKEFINRGEVELLGLLSEHLREEVQMNLHVGTIAKHPLLNFLSLASPQLVRKLSVEALLQVECSCGDTIFSVGEELDTMGFLESGILLYSTMPVGKDGEANWLFLSLQRGKEFQMFCEAPLWTHWRTRGNLAADTDCTILELSGAGFRKCVSRHPGMTNVVKCYAREFVQVLNSARGGAYDEPLTDLHGAYAYEEQIQNLFAAPWMQDPKSTESSWGFAKSTPDQAAQSWETPPPMDIGRRVKSSEMQNPDRPAVLPV